MHAHKHTHTRTNTTLRTKLYTLLHTGYGQVRAGGVVDASLVQINDG